MKKTPIRRKPFSAKKSSLKKTALKTKTSLNPAGKKPLNKKPLKNNGSKPKKNSFKPKLPKKNVKRKPIRRESNTALARELKGCDLAFSRWLRLSCADKEGMVGCYTCDYRGYWKNGGIEAGHFKSRTHKNTRWLRLNVAPQCQMCNGHRSGNLKVFADNLTRDFGEGVVEHLNRESKKSVQLTVLKVRKLREYFEERLLKLRQKLHL